MSAENKSLNLEKITKDPTQIDAEIFINTSFQIKEIQNYSLNNRKVKHVLTYSGPKYTVNPYTSLRVECHK
jgi:hypothetical protein